jgi:ABC-type transporter Mla maintaining outer membrane lipid asymmetry permease subunit MlaE
MEVTSISTGTTINRSLEWFGDLGSFSWKVIRAALTRPFELREIIRQLDELGSKSVPLVALSGAAIGAVLALESRSSLLRFGAKSMRFQPPWCIRSSTRWGRNRRRAGLDESDGANRRH